MGSSFGKIFTITSFGESHGPGIGVVIDGCPANLPLDTDQLQAELTRRRPGQSSITTPRKEADEAEILSGVFEGHTLGTPIAILVRNTNTKGGDYEAFRHLFRPSHADFTYYMKYGYRTWLGGGRASARETIARVAAGAVARQVLAHFLPKLEIVSWVQQIGDIQATVDYESVSQTQVDANIVRCPDPTAAEKMEAKIREVRHQGDSIGGLVGCVIRGVPAGLGEPAFHKLEAELARGVLSIPATKSFSFGSGYQSLAMTGSQHNDLFMKKGNGSLGTQSNYSGGVQGGISNGEPIYYEAVFKPTATILKEQPTIDEKGQAVSFKGRGRHDPCVLPRAVPIVEAMAALTLLDMFLWQRARQLSN